MNLDGAVSVTHDAKAVTATVYAQYGPRRIIYRDTMGNWDELVHADGVFSGFAPYRQEVREQAPEDLARTVGELASSDRINGALGLLRGIDNLDARWCVIRLAISSGLLSGPQVIYLTHNSIPQTDWQRLGIQSLNSP